VGWLTGAGLGLIAACAGCAGGGGDGGWTGAAWGYEVEHVRLWVQIQSSVDVLLVVDDSPAMQPFQAAYGRSLESFLQEIPDRLDHGPCSPVRLGVLTTSGDGHLSDRVGTQTWIGGEPSVTLVSDPACRIVGMDNLSCLFDRATQSGTAIVGFEGSPYPRGLSVLRRFLEGPEAQEFLRPEASLAVIHISAGEDCGEPGEVAEGLPGMDGRICSYAAKGVGPDGSTSHPDDPLHLPYALSPIGPLHDQLLALKGDRVGMVQFAAIVGLTDSEHPEATVIEFEGAEPSAGVAPACTLAGCTGEGCGALPGTRAIALAAAFGPDYGLAAPICEAQWAGVIQALGGFTSCPAVFRLERPVLDLGLLAFFVNGEPLPRHSCADLGAMARCEGPGDPSCACVETYAYFAPGDPGGPDPSAPGGSLVFAPHLDLCGLCPAGGREIELELYYVVAP